VSDKFLVFSFITSRALTVICSFGALLYEMLSGRRLQTAALPLPPYPEKLPVHEGLRRIITDCVLEEPFARPLVGELLTRCDKLESEEAYC
jgi:hypothetical protein